VLSASALVAIGTSLLLAALVGLGISELGTGDSGGPSSTMRTEAASVIVPGSDPKPAPAVKHSRRPSRPSASASYPWTPPAGQTGPAPSTSGGSTSASTLRSTKTVSPTATPSPTATQAHGNGKAKGAGAGNGHHKPSKH